MKISWLIGFGLVACLTVSDATSAESTSLLADAVKKNDLQAARTLLDQQVDVRSAQVDGMTALHWAVYHDEFSLVQRILAAGADVATQNRYGVSPLSIACQNGSSAIVKLLLDAGAEPNEKLHGGETPLMTASRTGQVGPVQELLARGADVNATERKGQTAIMWAAADGHVAVVDALIEAGADFRTPLASGFTPFFFAVREGRIQVVERMIVAGIDVNDPLESEKSTGSGPRSGISPLNVAVENGHLELAEKLLEAGADPNAKGSGYTALHAITWVRKPMRGDGDPSPIGSGKLSSLDFVRKLVEYGADVNARHTKKNAGGSHLNRVEATPFVLAAETADVPLMQLLVELGADPMLANADDSTPLLAACGVGVLGNGDDSAGTEDEVIETVSLLLDLGADINAVDKAGNSAMHGAAYQSWTKLVAFLSEKGADVDVWNRKNKREWTPLLIAEGHRPGNFRPSPETVVVIHRAMRASGVEPPTAKAPKTKPK
ncbi:MAG: ankyrin repeat domain-containing protein [Pirellulaceae bacterium]|nr:ankyrin repeat domain-containing protein [Pirellulaceae bacterium]